jgi:hypothetical protein
MVMMRTIAGGSLGLAAAVVCPSFGPVISRERLWLKETDGAVGSGPYEMAKITNGSF